MVPTAFFPTALSAVNSRLIYVSHKGFLPGPYEHRTALDEVVQMMGGLAYMTGRPGDPLRAGTSVNDIMGGMFGAIGVLGALIQRGISGRGMEVQSALYENNVFLMGQHLAITAPTGTGKSTLLSSLAVQAIEREATGCPFTSSAATFASHAVTAGQLTSTGQ